MERISKNIMELLIPVVKFNEIEYMSKAIPVLSECILSTVECGDFKIIKENGFLEFVHLENNKRYKLNKIAKIFIDKFIKEANLDIDNSELEKDDFNSNINCCDIETAKVNLENARKLLFLLKIMERVAILYRDNKIDKFEVADTTDINSCSDSDKTIFIDVGKEEIKASTFSYISRGLRLRELNPYEIFDLGMNHNFVKNGFIAVSRKKDGSNRIVTDMYAVDGACSASDIIDLSEDIKSNSLGMIVELSNKLKELYPDYSHVVKSSENYPFLVKIETLYSSLVK